MFIQKFCAIFVRSKMYYFYLVTQIHFLLQVSKCSPSCLVWMRDVQCLIRWETCPQNKIPFTMFSFWNIQHLYMLSILQASSALSPGLCGRVWMSADPCWRGAGTAGLHLHPAVELQQLRLQGLGDPQLGLVPALARLELWPGERVTERGQAKHSWLRHESLRKESTKWLSTE